MMGKDKKSSEANEEEQAMTKGQAKEAAKGQKKSFISRAKQKLKIGKH